MATETNENEVNTEAKQDRTRRRWGFDPENAKASVFDPTANETREFSLAALPNDVVKRLAFLGFSALVSKADDMEAAYNSLLEGKIGQRGNGTGVKKDRPLDFKRHAIALSIVDATKKTAEPLTIEQAIAKVRGFGAATVKAFMLNTTVIKHFNRLSGNDGDISKLLAAEEVGSDAAA
jgi:hypothetical protein